MQAYCGNPTEQAGGNLSLMKIVSLCLVTFHSLQSIPWNLKVQKPEIEEKHSKLFLYRFLEILCRVKINAAEKQGKLLLTVDYWL